MTFNGEYRRQGAIIYGRMDNDDDLLDAFHALAEDAGFTAGFVLSAVGKLTRVDLGYSQGGGRYERVSFHESLLLISCSGNIALADGKLDAHLHVVMGDAEHRARTGHFFTGRITGPIEFAVLALEGDMLDRSLDETTGLPILRLAGNPGTES